MQSNFIPSPEILVPVYVLGEFPAFTGVTDTFSKQWLFPPREGFLFYLLKD